MQRPGSTSEERSVGQAVTCAGIRSCIGNFDPRRTNLPEVEHVRTEELYWLCTRAGRDLRWGGIRPKSWPSSFVESPFLGIDGVATINLHRTSHFPAISTEGREEEEWTSEWFKRFRAQITSRSHWVIPMSILDLRRDEPGSVHCIGNKQ